MRVSKRALKLKYGRRAGTESFVRQAPIGEIMKTTLEAIKELREKTGAAMMACKQALENAGGDIETAFASLKELGLAQAKNREERVVNEGRVFVRATGKKSVLVKLACETDFVSRNADFIRLGEACLDAAFGSDPETAKSEIGDLIADMIGRIRENIVLKRLAELTAGSDEIVSSYLHDDGRIGVSVRLSAGNPESLLDPSIAELLGDLALHTAAYAPEFLSRESVDPAFLELKTAEFLEEVKTQGKPAAMVDTIVRGKLEKLFSKVCLLEQPWIRDDGRTVGKILEEAGKRHSCDLRLTGFLYDRIESAGNMQAALQYMRK